MSDEEKPKESVESVLRFIKGEGIGSVNDLLLESDPTGATWMKDLDERMKTEHQAYEVKERAKFVIAERRHREMMAATMLAGGIGSVNDLLLESDPTGATWMKDLDERMKTEHQAYEVKERAKFVIAERRHREMMAATMLAGREFQPNTHAGLYDVVTAIQAMDRERYPDERILEKDFAPTKEKP